MNIFAVISRKATRTLLLYVLLSINILTDAYGFSQQAGKKSNNKGVSQASFAKKHPELGTSVVQNNDVITDRSIKDTQPLRMVNVQETLNPEDKVILEIKELKRMHQKLTKEMTKDLNDAKKLQLLQHVNKQIEIRQQQQQNKRKYRIASDQNNHVTRPRKAQQMHTPRQRFADTHPSSGQRHGVLQTLGQRDVAQQTMRHNILQQQQEPQNVDLSSHVHLETQTINRLRKQSNHQQNNIVSANHTLLPHSAGQVLYQPDFIQREPLTVNSYQLNRPVAEQISPQYTGILVPVSALSSNHILNSQGLQQDKIILVNPISIDNTLHAVSNGDLSTAAPTTQLPKPLYTTKATTTASTKTTEKPSTTTSMSIPTSTSTQVSTSAFDLETLKHDFLQREMKKQELEIRKLRLEIRALQREERMNLPEMENDDFPQQRRKQLGRRRPMPSYIGD